MRQVSRIWCVAVLVACAKSDDPKKQQVAAPAPAVDAAVDAAATTIDVPWTLATATSVAALPAKPVAYIFVPPDGTMLVGTTPSLAAATVVTDNASLQKLVPPDPDAPPPPPDDGWGTIGTGTYGTLHGSGAGVGGTGQGYGVGIGGGGGSYVAQSFHGARTEPGKARLVLVADATSPVMTIGRVVIALREPIAIAVRDENGAIAALPLPLVGPGGGGPGAGVELILGSQLQNLVNGVGAAPAGAEPLAITVRGGSSGMRGRDPGLPTVRIGNATAVGDLDKNIIRRYIKRNIQKMQYCYEKELVKKPELAGTVTAEFVIDPQGNVPSSKANGVSPDVSSCIAGVIKQIQFPKPTGGGIVKVSYPFTFRPTGN